MMGDQMRMQMQEHGFFMNLNDTRDFMLSAMDFNQSNATNATGNCTTVYERMDFIDTKFMLVGCMGTTVAVLGILANSLLVYVFFRPSIRLSSVLYLAVLAMLDIWMLLTYILIFPMSTWYEYFMCLPLFRFWLFYVRPMLTISKIIQLASTYLIVSATMERFLTQIGFKCRTKKRAVVVASVLSASVILKWSTYLEIGIVDKPGCEGFVEREVEPSPLAQNEIYRTVVSFYMTHIIQVFLPFAMLLVLNALIILRMKQGARLTRNETVRSIAKYPKEVLLFEGSDADKNSHEATMQQRIEQKKQVREATHMLIMIVFMYLIVNSVSLVVTFMEHTAGQWLYDHPKFYTFSVDAISFLSVLNSSTRFFIYYCFNGTIRGEFIKIFCMRWRNSRGDYDPVRRPKKDRKKRNGGDCYRNRSTEPDQSPFLRATPSAPHPLTDKHNIEIHANGRIHHPNCTKSSIEQRYTIANTNNYTFPSMLCEEYRDDSKANGGGYYTLPQKVQAGNGTFSSTKLFQATEPSVHDRHNYTVSHFRNDHANDDTPPVYDVVVAQDTVPWKNMNGGDNLENCAAPISNNTAPTAPDRNDDVAKCHETDGPHFRGDYTVPHDGYVLINKRVVPRGDVDFFQLLPATDRPLYEHETSL